MNETQLQSDFDLIPQEVNPLDEIDFINFDSPLPQQNHSTVQAVEKPVVDYSNIPQMPLIQVQHNLVMPASNFHGVVSEVERGEVGNQNQQKPVQPHYPQKPINNNVQQPKQQPVQTPVVQPKPKTPEEIAEEERWKAEDNKFNIIAPKITWYAWIVIALGVGVLVWYFFLK